MKVKSGSLGGTMREGEIPSGADIRQGEVEEGILELILRRYVFPGAPQEGQSLPDKSIG